MLTSFSTALSALNANSIAIDVVGNNLANLSTPGFKAATPSFHDLVTQSIGNGLGSTQVGFGVGVPVTLRHFSQGAVQATAGPLDAAIQGDGFFVVKNAAGGTQYTRGGNFQVDLNGVLITSTRDQLQGWSISNGVLDTNTAVGAITVPVGSLAAARATKDVSVDLNLDATGVNAAASGTFSTAVEFYDSLGVSHIATFTFTKAATANTWDYSVSVPAGDTTGAPTPLTGTLTFDSNGQLLTPTATDAAPALSVVGLKSGATDLTINWNLYKGLSPRITQFAQPSATSAIEQNGSQAANLIGVSLGDGGKILAKYSNGQQTLVGQLAMAGIRNPESLIAVGNNNYETSALTAQPAIGLPGTGGRGTALGGSIESSTSDIAKEFTNLIIFQRGYQASARVITTVDEVSQETINLKR